MMEQPSVSALMDGGLADWLAGQQQLRTDTAAKSRKVSWISAGIGVAAGLFAMGALGLVQIAFGVGAAIIAAGQLWAHSIRRPVIAAIKQEMNTRIAESLGCSFFNAAMPGPELQLAFDHDLLPSHDKKEMEDHWQGEIGTMPFSLYEVHLEEWRGSGKNRRLETVFRGALISIGFARKFHGVTLVERQGTHMTFFGLRDTITKNGVELGRIKMVHPEFEDDFTCWGSDPVEARYLVHPAYVERLIELERDFHGRDIRALFHGGSLIIAIEADDNMFESGSLDADKDRVRMEETIGQFVTLANMATELNERPRG